MEPMREYWRIYYEVFEDGKKIGRGVYPKSYKYKQDAQRRAKKMWGEPQYNQLTNTTITYEWQICQNNPWEKGSRIYNA